jgi:ferredoxin-NADP reductase
MRGALMERYTATVTRVRRETPDTVTLYFTSDREFSYTAGQYITVFFPDSSTPEGKAYSLSSAPYEAWLSITVKRVGEYSTRLHALRAGDTFTISAAYGFFNPKTDQPLVGISAGCGLAPIWSIVKDELERDSKRVVKLFFSNRTTRDVPYADRLAEREARHAGVEIRHHITRETPPPTMQAGRIDLDTCVHAVEGEAMYLLCGSVDFVRDMWRGLVDRGVATSAINTETFFE